MLAPTFPQQGRSPCSNQQRGPETGFAEISRERVVDDATLLPRGLVGRVAGSPS